jgi:PAS domain S-box-containing protein
MLTQRERTALGAAVAIVLGAIVAAAVAREPAWQRVFDNVHWTTSFTAAAWLAWLGAKRARQEEAAPRRMFAYALSAYAVGQLIWVVQVFADWNPFPGPADPFFLCLGPVIAVGIIGFVQRQTNSVQRKLITLDVSGLTLAVLALTLALYLPKRTDEQVVQLALLVAYPVMFCSTACVGVISALTLALAPARGWLLLLFGLLLNSGLWLTWNALQLDQALTDGTWFNAMFSIAALMQGYGALHWRGERSSSERWQRACSSMLRLLPLFIVLVGALAATLAHSLPGVPPVVRWIAWIGGAVVALLASARQSVLIAEHEALIRNERALRQTEAVYRVLFEHATEGIFIADQTGRYTDVNLRGAEMLQRTREEILRLGMQDIIVPEERSRISGAIADTTGGVTRDRPWTLVRKDKTTFPAEVSGVLLPDGRLLGTVRDVSERVALEGQLRQAQKMEAVGTLAAGIAHDFNNLIAAIAGNAEIAAAEPGSGERTAQSLAEIRAASARAAELVRQIAAFSRPQEPSTAVADLRRTIDEVARLLRSTLPAGVELRITVSPDAPHVRIDASQVHQVLVNLATNAWQAMEDRPGTIAIRIEAATLTASNPFGLEPGPYASVEISDDGSGMDAHTSERIFEPFFTTKEIGKGTGLGLAIVHRIIREHRGAITVRSELGQGTTFQILLPAADAISRPLHPQADARVAAPTERRGLRVCYVDDESVLVSMIQRHLVREGHSLQGFSSSEDALAALQAAPHGFDVLITDYNMPKLSGLELLTELKPLRPDHPFVLTSGSIDPSLRTRAARAGVRSVLQKPYSLAELEQAIAEAAQRQEAEVK